MGIYEDGLIKAKKQIHNMSTAALKAKLVRGSGWNEWARRIAIAELKRRGAYTPKRRAPARRSGFPSFNFRL